MHKNPKMRRVVISITLVSVCLFCQKSLPLPIADSSIYATGTKFTLTARWLGFSADGVMEILENTRYRGEEVLLVRSQVTEIGGFLGFIAKFLRVYKGSNTFDSYIDADTLMVMEYEIYKVDEDGSKKVNEHVYFDRKQNKVVSLLNSKVVASNVASDIQDTFSAFLTFLYRLNTERIYSGKEFSLDVYGYEQAFKVDIEITRYMVYDGAPVYMLEVKELPAVFKHPASLAAEVTYIGQDFMFPVRGKCKIRIPLWPDITVKAELGVTGHSD